MLFIKALLGLWKLFVDVRENFLTIFKEISKDACQKQSYKSWHRGRKCTGGSFLIPLGIWFISKDFFPPPVCFPINTYIWGKRVFKYIWFKPRSSLCSFWHWQQYAVSDFRNRERKQYCIFLSPVMHTNMGHFMSGPQHGLFKIEPFFTLKTWLHSTAPPIMVLRVHLF